MNAGERALKAAADVRRSVVDLLSPAAKRIREDRERAAAERLERRLKDVRLLMSVDWGRRFLHDLLGKAGTHADTFSSDPLVMARLAGRRSVGTDLQRELAQSDPEAFLRMMREAMDAGTA